ncbi:hypothetical protein AB0G74_06425 [Streptomyces sp. NPDC020875]|uniref:hypothetical protein n=1 Tax=Streptomyces sp. NPDC020875 TaxID=3154898 RepID=UPI0033F3DB58
MPVPPPADGSGESPAAPAAPAIPAAPETTESTESPAPPVAPAPGPRSAYEPYPYEDDLLELAPEPSATPGGEYEPTADPDSERTSAER